MPREHEIPIRVRYADTDQMSHAYYARYLEWFEQGRTELLRSLGRCYALMEADGLWLPVTEAYCKYLGQARYDEVVLVTTCVEAPRRARLRFHYGVRAQDDGRPLAEGYTVHACTTPEGKPFRPPRWFLDLLDGNSQDVPST